MGIVVIKISINPRLPSEKTMEASEANNHLKSNSNLHMKPTKLTMPTTLESEILGVLFDPLPLIID